MRKAKTITMIAKATMFTGMRWEGDVPASIPEDDRWDWVKNNILGGEYEQTWSDWSLDELEEDVA